MKWVKFRSAYDSSVDHSAVDKQDILHIIENLIKKYRVIFKFIKQDFTALLIFSGFISYKLYISKWWAMFT